MRNVISPSQVKTYLSELWEDEEGLVATADAFEAAKSRYEMRLLRYQALRDFIQGQLGESPYARPAEEWPDKWATRGRYRFAGMKLGEAIGQILMEADGPMSMENIIDKLGEGGAGLNEPVQPRAVAAALTHTAGIRKITHGPAEGMYFVVDPDKEHEARAWKGELEVDDLPFE